MPLGHRYTARPWKSYCTPNRYCHPLIIIITTPWYLHNSTMVQCTTEIYQGVGMRTAQNAYTTCLWNGRGTRTVTVSCSANLSGRGTSIFHWQEGMTQHAVTDNILSDARYLSCICNRKWPFWGLWSDHTEIIQVSEQQINPFKGTANRERICPAAENGCSNNYCTHLPCGCSAHYDCLLLAP